MSDGLITFLASFLIWFMFGGVLYLWLINRKISNTQAAHAIFPELKKKLGKLAITVLTDSLYANEPFIQLCKELRWEYLIVRQVGSLKTVGSKCDKLEELELYQKSYQSQQITEKST